MSLLSSFARNESGATAIEYSLIAAGISVAIVVVVQILGTNLNTTFTTVANALKSGGKRVSDSEARPNWPGLSPCIP